MNNIRYSANASRMVNKGIGLGSRPLGKGSRATTYNNIIRTNADEVSARVAQMRFKRMKSTQCHGTDKWLLEDNASAHAHNLEHLLYFSELPRRKQGTPPALPTLVEFVVFLINHPSQVHAIGAFKVQKKITTIQKTTIVQDTIVQDTDDDFGQWGNAPQTTVNDAQWGDEPPDFHDEEDLIQ